MVQQFSKKNRPTESHSDRKYIGVSRYCGSLIRFIAAEIHGHICTVRWKWYMAITQESVCEKLCGRHTDIKRLINWTWNMLHFFTGWFHPYHINPSGATAWIFPGHLGTVNVDGLDPWITISSAAVAIIYVRNIGPPITCGRISVIFNISVPRNYEKCKYVFMISLNDWAGEVCKLMPWHGFDKSWRWTEKY